MKANAEQTNADGMNGHAEKVEVVVLGAGVLGLCCALELTKRGVKVAVVARDLPEDLDSASFASPWAGANWSSFAEPGSREARWDVDTFNHYAELSKSHPHVVMRIPFKRVWNEPEVVQPPWFKDLVFGFRPMEKDELPKGWKHGETFESYTMCPPAYLAYLAGELRKQRVPFIRSRLSSIDEAYSIPTSTTSSLTAPPDPNSLLNVDLVVNATGLGAKSLLGVEDPNVYPIRGDTVLVRAPGVKAVYKTLGQKTPEELSQGKRFYIIPRPGPNDSEAGDHVVLGGTELDDDWDTLPRPQVSERILKDAYAMCPQLSGGKGWENIEVVSLNVGLRPARRGGPRVELEERVLGSAKVGKGGAGVRLVNNKVEQGEGGEARKVGLVHAYGIGPAGYQASVGVSKQVADLVNQYFKGRKV